MALTIRSIEMKRMTQPGRSAGSLSGTRGRRNGTGTDQTFIRREKQKATHAGIVERPRSLSLAPEIVTKNIRGGKRVSSGAGRRQLRLIAKVAQVAPEAAFQGQPTRGWQRKVAWSSPIGL